MRNPALHYDAAYRRCLGLTLAVIAFALSAVVVGTGSASAAGPTCPSGSTYNKATKQCERLPTVVCPTATSYEPATGLCTGPTTGSCVEGYTYNEATGKCEASACAEGYFYAVPHNICAQTDGPGLANPSCPPGPGGSTIEHVPYTGDPEDPNIGKCLYEPPPTCSQGLAYDAGRDKCVAVPQYTCPQGYGYNTLTGKCQTAPTRATKPPKT